MASKKVTDILQQKTAALYVRVSTDKQEELSPDSQIKLGYEYAKKNNLYIPKDNVFRDDGISGRKAVKRHDFQRMIALAKSKDHPIDVIIVWKFSRFARNQEESIVYKSLLKKNHVDVVSISEPTIDGPFGSLIERIIEWMDEYYSIRLSGEVIRGMTENANRGKYQADPPIGYIMPKGTEIPVKDPATVHIPLLIKQSFLEKPMTVKQIAKKLNSLGYKTKRGNLFDDRGVRYILENPFYYGMARWNYTDRGRVLKSKDEVIYSHGNWEPLWSEDTYKEIMARLAEIDAINATKYGGTRKKDVSSCLHWLSGLLFCSSCGKSLAYSGAKSARGFQCWAYGKGLCNESHYIGQSIAESHVIAALEQLLVSDHLDYTVVKADSSDESDSDDELKILEGHLSKLELRGTRIKEAYADGIDTLAEYKENKIALQEELDAVNKRIDELKASTSEQPVPDQNNYNKLMIHNISDVISILKDESVDYNIKGNALRSIVDKIVFDRKNTSFDFYLKLVV